MRAGRPRASYHGCKRFTFTAYLQLYLTVGVLQTTRAADFALPTPHRSSSCSANNLALSRPFHKLLVAAVACFILLAAILASLRLGVRPPSLIQYLKPSPLRTPFSQAFRPLTNSTMACHLGAANTTWLMSNRRRSSTRLRRNCRPSSLRPSTA
jgi:hypothetical protein